jgi:paraquat-inducible protein B
VPPAQARSQAQAQVKPKLDKQLDQIDQQTKAKRKKLDQTATDPRLQDLKSDITKTRASSRCPSRW